MFRIIPGGKKYVLLQGVIFRMALLESILPIVAKYLLCAAVKITYPFSDCISSTVNLLALIPANVK
jgi:hypothetical protein